MHRPSSDTLAILGVITLLIIVFASNRLTGQRLSPEAMPLDAVVASAARLPNGTLAVPPGGILLTDGTVLREIAAIAVTGTVLIRDTDQFQIVYEPADKSYSLWIDGESFPASRAAAENELLSVLDETPQETCQRAITVIGAPYAHPTRAYETSPLFCT